MTDEMTASVSVENPVDNEDTEFVNEAESFDNDYSEEAAGSGRAKKRSGQGKRALAELLVGALVLAGVCLGLRHVRSEYVKAEQEFAENNYTSVRTLPDGTVRVSGAVEGEFFEYIEDGRIVEGVSVGGIDLSGMDYEQARRALIDGIAEKISGINICATVGNKTHVLTATDFKVSTSRDVNELIHEALRVGRTDEGDMDYYAIYKERERIKQEGVQLEGFNLVMDENSMRAIVDSIADDVDQAPIEPYITMLNRVGGGKPGVGIGGPASDLFTSRTIKAPNGTTLAEMQFHNGQNGFVVDRDDMLSQIVSAFENENYNAELQIALNETAPDRTAEELADSIEEIARFSTAFASSSSYRARNVQKAAGLLNCVVMEPGVDYSYNEILGPRNEIDGWLPAPGISGGKEYIDSPGGGICQVSSTLYNSLLKLGPDIKIVRRSHHSIPGGYIDMGLDATVSYGGPDLVWRNMTDSQMILISYADMSRRVVYEIIYGVMNEERCTYRIWSETVEVIEPPETLRVAEPLWPTGYSKMVIQSRKGYNVNVYRQKYDSDGNAVGEPVQLYQDKYAAVRGELHYGTGSSTLPIPQG